MRVAKELLVEHERRGFYAGTLEKRGCLHRGEVSLVGGSEIERKRHTGVLPPDYGGIAHLGVVYGVESPLKAKLGWAEAKNIPGNATHCSWTSF